MVATRGKDRIFAWIAARSVGSGGYEPPVYAAEKIAAFTGEPLRRARAWLQELERDGLVKEVELRVYDENAMRERCLVGYALTQKGEETEVFRTLEEQAL